MEAKRISIDISFKHVYGWQEFEIEGWDNHHRYIWVFYPFFIHFQIINLISVMVLSYAFTTSQSADVHVVLFCCICSTVEQDTSVPVQFLHIHSMSIESVVANGHHGQALGKFFLTFNIPLQTCYRTGQILYRTLLRHPAVLYLWALSSHLWPWSFYLQCFFSCLHCLFQAMYIIASIEPNIDFKARGIVVYCMSYYQASMLTIHTCNMIIQWGAKPLQCLTPNQGMKCPAINCGNFTLLWWEQIKYKPLAITLSPGSCDFAYILPRYIHFKTSIPLQQFCTFCFPGYISTWYSLSLPW